jgi:O-antigen ligase
MIPRAERRSRGQRAMAATVQPLPLAAPGGRALFRRLDPLRLALSLLVLMTISRANGLVPGLAVLRPLLLLSGIAFAYAVLNPRLLSDLPWKRTWAARLVAALGIVACISGIFGISLGGTGRFILETYSKVLVTAFLVMATVRSPQDLHRYIWVYVIACGLLVWQALFVFEMQQVGDGLYRLGEMVTYDANDVGVVLLVGLAFALYTFELSGPRGKLASGAIIVGIGAALAKSGSRGAFLGLVVFGVGAVLFLDTVPLARRILAVLGVATGLALASPQGYWDQMRTILSPKEDYNWTSETGRRNTFKRGVGYLVDRPVFGVGAGNFGMAEGTLSERARNWKEGDAGVGWTAPHNTHLQIGAELGVVGLGIWFILLYRLSWSTLRIGQALPKRWRRGTFDERVLHQLCRTLPLATLAFAASSSFVSFAYNDIIYFLAALAAGLLVLVPRGALQRGRR